MALAKWKFGAIAQTSVYTLLDQRDIIITVAGFLCQSESERRLQGLKQNEIP